MKTVIAMLIVMLPLSVLAQFRRGQIFVGGFLSGSSETYNSMSSKEVTNQLNVYPSAGYFLNSKILVGSSLGYYTSRRLIHSNGVTQTAGRSNSFYLAPFVRNYFVISESFSIAFQGQLTLMRGTIESQIGSIYSSRLPTYSVSADISPIFIFFPSPKWGIEAGIGSVSYTYYRVLPDVSSTNTFSFSSGKFTFGLTYYFSKKEK
jgi:hypothetical protein